MKKLLVLIMTIIICFAVSGCGQTSKSITSASINSRGELVVYYSDGNSENLGKVVGRDGVDGSDGINGDNGTNGINGTNGLAPRIGANGNWWIGAFDTGIYAGDVCKTIKLELFSSVITDEIPYGQICVEMQAGTAYKLLPVLHKDGMEFLGWWSGVAETDKKFSKFDPIYDSITLYARFRPLSPSYYSPFLSMKYDEIAEGYTVSYEDNDYFAFTDSITEVTLPRYYDDGVNGKKPVNRIGFGAFNSFLNVKELIIPETIDSVGQYAFSNMSKLERITFLGDTAVGGDAFARCSSLKEINVVANGKNTYENGVLIDKSIGSISHYSYFNAEMAYTVPSGVKYIAGHAFEGNKYLQQVTLPAIIERIQFRAFIGCSALETISLPPKVVEINSGLFDGCTSLSSVIFEGNIVRVGEYSFASCTSLSQIILPTSVQRVDATAFYGWTSDQEIVFQGAKENIQFFNNGETEMTFEEFGSIVDAKITFQQ